MVLKSRLIHCAKDVPPSLFSRFTKVLIQDSTVIELHERLQEHFQGSGGRSSKSCLKIDVIYDLISKNYEKFTLTDQGETDSSLAVQIDDVVTEGTLVIRDLGYLRVEALRRLVEKKAFYLSRLKSSFRVFMSQDSPIVVDLADCFNDEENEIDIPVYITEDRLQVRLIAYRAAPEVVEKRKRLANATAKKQGRSLTKKSLKFLEFTVFITTVSPEDWPAEVIGTIYAIRWQIELLFKSWKSGMSIHYLKGTNENRIISLVYARLILVMIINEIYKLASGLTSRMKKTVSLAKVTGWMRDPERLLRFLKGTLTLWEKKSFLDTVLRTMCQQRRHRITTLEAIRKGISYDKYYALA